MHYMTQEWKTAKETALNTATAVSNAQKVAKDKIKTICGQDAFTHYCHPWSAHYESDTYAILYQLKITDHWNLSLTQVREITKTLIPWTFPERWETYWAEIQR